MGINTHNLSIKCMLKSEKAIQLKKTAQTRPQSNLWIEVKQPTTANSEMRSYSAMHRHTSKKKNTSNTMERSTSHSCTAQHPTPYSQQPSFIKNLNAFSSMRCFVGVFLHNSFRSFPSHFVHMYQFYLVLFNILSYLNIHFVLYHGQIN